MDQTLAELWKNKLFVVIVQDQLPTLSRNVDVIRDILNMQVIIGRVIGKTSTMNFIGMFLAPTDVTACPHNAHIVLC